jgi:hypothetical protein
MGKENGRKQQKQEEEVQIAIVPRIRVCAINDKKSALAVLFGHVIPHYYTTGFTNYTNPSRNEN